MQALFFCCLAAPTVEFDDRASGGVSVKAGSMIEIPALVDGRPFPSARWSRNEVILLPDQRVTVDLVDKVSTLRILGVLFFFLFVVCT